MNSSSLSFIVPDMTPPAKFSPPKRTLIEIPFRAGDEDLHLKLTFERSDEEAYWTYRAYHPSYQKARLYAEIYGPGEYDRRSYVHAILCYGKDIELDVPRRAPDHLYWRIYSRHVEPAARGRGLGTATFAAFEGAMDRLHAAYPDLKADTVLVETRLASLTRLLIDQGWLEEHGLDEFKRSDGRNFGYIPQVLLNDTVRRVLRIGATDLDEALKKDAPSILLVKRL